ncbi:PNK3P-domain-containing protein [Meredithblackwellia eburnea MCA 4105]
MSSGSSSKRPFKDAFPPSNTIASTSQITSNNSKTPKLASIFNSAPSAASNTSSFWKKDVSTTCPHGIHGNPKGSSKVAAFDLDGTIIVTKSGNKFPKDKTDFMFLYPEIPRKLKELHQDGYAIVFISNQAGPNAQQQAFKDKMPLFASNISTVPFHAFAALDYDKYRKPATGAWEIYVEKFNGGIPVDYEQSFYVGDAAGRQQTASKKADHSDCDIKMAMNAGLNFHTPEEFFRSASVYRGPLKGYDPRTHDHNVPLFTPTNKPLVPKFDEFTERVPDVVLFVGFPASGKTSLFNKYFAPAGYAHINQDTLKTRDACLRQLRACLSSSPPQSCVVDNTNPARATRKQYLDLIRKEFPKLKITVRAFVFDASVDVAKHNAAWRAVYDPESGRDMLPLPAFTNFANSLEPVSEGEGFDEIKHIGFRIDDLEQRRKWEKWLDIYKKEYSGWKGGSSKKK